MDLHQEVPQETLQGGSPLRDFPGHGASDSVGVGNLPPDEEQESVRHIPDDLNGDATSSEALNAE